jgi:hypothetical protein
MLRASVCGCGCRSDATIEILVHVVDLELEVDQIR